ncbi:Hypothetical protein SCLAV_5383 [Streptomyces clavuligerus]|uniref:Uncharacterized protein n=1 Tax=Streptomyces clavuligerus TaxID=1901 RepID=E2Q0A7_STRCL|nr:Hypothetical protein SCLAV_5383 [Streptomyces clavuligerus]
MEGRVSVSWLDGWGRCGPRGHESPASRHRAGWVGLLGAEARAFLRRDAVSEEVKAALRNPVKAHALLGEEFGFIPFKGFVRRMACADTVIHGSDPAWVTGQDEVLDSEAVATAAGILLPEDGDIRVPGAFGAKVPSAAVADARTRLPNFLGRRIQRALRVGNPSQRIDHTRRGTDLTCAASCPVVTRCRPRAGAALPLYGQAGQPQGQGPGSEVSAN